MSKLTWEESKSRSECISEIEYTLALDLTNSESFSADCTISFVSSHSTPTWLDLEVKQITSLSMNEEVLQYEYSGFRVSLASVQAGRNTISLSYEGAYRNDGTGLHKFIDPEDNETYIYTQFEPYFANKVFPCFDQPDLKACLTLTVKSPISWKVISNEFGCIETYETYSEHIFNTTPKLSTYLFAVCAGPFTEFTYDNSDIEIPLRYFCRRSLSSYLNPSTYFYWTVQGLKFYSQFFDRPYPFSKYDQVFVPEFNIGAMENVGCVTLKESYIFRESPSYVQLGRACSTFMHEMAHMWFGNLVTMRWWNDLWLNESFATFMSHICISNALSQDFPNIWSEFLSRKGWGYLVDQLSTSHPISTLVMDTDEGMSLFDGISYSKGSAVIKQLYYKVGHFAFSDALTRYMHDFAYKNAEFSDLIQYLAQPSFDINSWADSWVLTPGLNQLKSIFTYDTNGTIVEFAVKQSTCSKEFPVLRDHAIEIEGFDNNGESIGRFKAEIKAQELTKIPLFIGESPACVILNVGDWSHCKIRMDSGSLDFLKTKLHLIKEPLTKCLVWRAFYDMVRDSKMSGIEFIQIAVEMLERERDEKIGIYILEVSRPTLYNYVDKGSDREKLASLIFQLLLRSIKEGSEMYQKKLIDFCYRSDDILQAVAWIQGSHGLFKLSKVDIWGILKKYSEISCDAIELVNSFAEDQSDLAHLSKIYCEAAYPNPELKQKAWENFTTNLENLSRFERKSAMNGFNRPRQYELLHKYFEMYFETCKEFFKSKDYEAAKDFCEFLIPRYTTDQLLIDKLNLLIEDVEFYEIKRFLRERVDMLERFSKGKLLSKTYIETIN